MEPPSPSVYSSSPRSALHNRVSMLLNRSPQATADPIDAPPGMRPSPKLRLTIAPRPSFRALAMRSSTRPPSSTRSVIDATAPPVIEAASPTEAPPTLPSSPQDRIEALYASPLTPINHTWRPVIGETTHTALPTCARTQHRTRRQRQRQPWTALFTPSSFRRHRVRTKAILALTFGITLLIALAIYLGLAATGVGTGLMFHILFIIFILAMTTVFCHSLLTMCLLILKPKPRRLGTVDHIRPCSLSVADAPPEKPIPIVMASDEEAALNFSAQSPDTPESLERPILVRPPPPVYGYWRDTKRMDPSLVHWAKLPPSPDTPTYEEALQDSQRAIGHRPPSYVNGVLVQERDVRHDSTVHPLERERVEILFGETT